jgi:density-regulated protein
VDKKVRVIKLKRGGKKVICSIVGLELFGCDL